MKHPFLLWLALLFSLMTATSHASHFKGGTLTWKRVTTEPGFTARAEVTVSFDLSSDLLWPVNNQTPKVNGQWVYTPDMPVSANCELRWGDGASSFLDDFKVVAVDFAAQIVTLQATNESDIRHPYTTNGTYTMAIIGSDRDGSEELKNRQDTIMRVESTVKVDTTTPSANRPPVFNPAGSNLVIVPRQDPADPTMTFQAPVATDPDGDAVKYSFVASERNATDLAPVGLAPWEVTNGLTISEAGVISWNTSLIEQTVHSYAIQVVATDYDSSNLEAKSTSVLEFQVWVNDPDQDGVPEIGLAPDFETFTAHPGQLFQFRILGTDHNSLDEIENSRLEAVIPAQDMPPGAVLVPAGGFAGEDSGLPSHNGHGSRMEAVLSWTPTLAQANSQWTLHIKVRDDDGHLSTEKIVVINVGSPTTLQPLQLTVTGGTEETAEDGKPVIKIVGRQGTDLTFTVTGSTAVTGADLQLFSFDHLPHDSEMTPALPATGTDGSVQSIFTWENLTEEDLTFASDPHEVTFYVADQFGRETSRRVRIYIFPDAPSIELAPGEAATVEKQTWQTISFRYVVTGHGSLDVIPEVGTVDQMVVTGPHTGTLTWRVLPGQLTGNTIEVTVRDNYGQEDTLSMPVTVDPDPVVPAWWAGQGVLTGADADDHAVATQGQLKAIASKAYAEMVAADSSLPTLSPEGVDLAAYIASLSTTEGNYTPLLQGQLKHAAELFYKVITRKTDKVLGLPWTESGDDDRNYAPANIGQVKALFAFPLPLSTLFNDPPLVTLDTPVHGQTATAPATFQLAATASDPDGSIASVIFYNGTTPLYTDTESPYQYSWTSVAQGTYNITAKATDNRGAEQTSSVATVSSVPWVDPAPVVSITSPAANASFPNPAQITITATATDNIGVTHVVFYDGNNVIGTDSSPPYSITMQNVITGGTHPLSARAYDNLGRAGQSSTVNVTVAATVPNSTKLTLRNGYDNYNGMVDTYIASDRQGADNSRKTPLWVDRGSPNASALLKWDLTGLPANLNVTGVKLVLALGTSSREYEIYAVRGAWTPAGANWKERYHGKPWAVPGASDVNSDREDVVLGSLYVPEDISDYTTVTLNQDGVNKVKEWIADPSKNNGFIIQDYSGSGAPRLFIVSGDEEYANFRPALQIFYE